LLEHQPHGALTHFGGVLALPSHGSILSRFGASGKPGPVQNVWPPYGRRLPGAPTLTADLGTVDWLAGEWDERDAEPAVTDGPMPPPLWNGDRVDYEACVDALM